MTQETFLTGLQKAKERVRKNIRFAALNFIFIIAFVNVFQTIFGAENSIVGVIFAIMMSASMARDLTATPIKHLLVQALVLTAMAVCACAVTTLNPWAALPLNFVMILIILYAFTYEYASHLYFPYILSYLFLIFISPVGPAQLPKRLLGMITGAVCIILYQWFMGRKRVQNTARGVLCAMIEEADGAIHCLLEDRKITEDPERVRSNLCQLSRIVYERRKKVLCISDASFSMLDSGRGLENLIHLLYALQTQSPLSSDWKGLLQNLSGQLQEYRLYVQEKKETIAPFTQMDLIPQGLHPRKEDSMEDTECFAEEDTPTAEELYHCMSYIRDHLLQMTKPEKQAHYRKTVLSVSVRLKALLDISPVRVIYALRTAVLLSVCTLAVQLLQLPHGKWLLFTVASVSLPYADDIGTKAKKRFWATIVGGIASLFAYGLIPSASGRTAIMMLSGFLSFFLTDYVGTFACSTLGAMGGAVFLDTFGLAGVGRVFFIRMGYICAGILIGFLANKVFFPFRREKATKQLWKKYAATTELLTQVCKQKEIDPQLYYSLVIQTHLQEDKLRQNALAEGWHGMKDSLIECQKRVRAAHRRHLMEGGYSS